MHEKCVVGQFHFVCRNCPRHVLADYLPVIGVAVCGPVFRIYEIRTFQSLVLIVFYFRSSREFVAEFVAFGVRNHEIHIGFVHEIGERIGNGLRQGFRMRSPCHDHFRTFLFFVLFYGDEVGESLKRMTSSRFHTEYRPAGIFDELVDNRLAVIKILVFETCKRPYTDEVAVAPHYRDGLQKMFRFVPVHYHAPFGFQFPCSGIDIENDGVEPQVRTGPLCTEAGAQA